MATTTRPARIVRPGTTRHICVGDLALALGATEDLVGYGLRLLRTAGLVATRKTGRVVFYRLGPGFPTPLREHCLRQLVAMTRADTNDDDQETR